MSTVWQSALQGGLAALARGAHAEATSHFETAYRLAPHEPAVNYALGRELARTGYGDRVDELLSRAYNGDPTLVGAVATLARCAGLDGGELNYAHELLDGAIARGVDVSTLEIVRGELLLESGDVDGAREAAERATAAEHDEAVSLGAKALLSRVENIEGIELAARGNHQAALFMFRRAAIRDPAWPAPHINSAHAFEALDRLPQAVTSVERALAIVADDPDAIALHARLLSATGRESDALSELAEALAQNPDATELACTLAELSAAGGDPETAATVLTDLLARRPSDAAAWLTLGRAQLAAGFVAAAEECLRQTLDLEPENPDALMILADLLVKDGRYFEATALAERAQALDSPRASRYVWKVGGRPAPSKHTR